MLVRSLKIMMLLILSLSAYSVTADEQSVIFNHKMEVQKVQLDVNIDIAMTDLALELDDGVSATMTSPATEQPLVDNIDNFNFLNELRRVVSSDNRAGLGKIPNYYLLVAFMEPVLLDSASTAIATPKFVEHWTSKITRSTSRVSGWKDGNSLYSHYHIRFA
ncbi:hypothetical protein [Shewanella sp. 4_MG-2023]|uniref:hypothetical protein n=1 Tax=Shewanella sp. 4_MG-2023 TaxID=3062652 RepID=UPI0026E224CC|nr:hypothetical protein [Shewanella sp. 4_MG-2023]MDO6677590.1 hypothetical protein [Shewanella sp. 4_MG-2023]